MSLGEHFLTTINVIGSTETSNRQFTSFPTSANALALTKQKMDHATRATRDAYMHAPHAYARVHACMQATYPQDIHRVWTTPVDNTYPPGYHLWITLYWYNVSVENL